MSMDEINDENDMQSVSGNNIDNIIAIVPPSPPLENNHNVVNIARYNHIEPQQRGRTMSRNNLNFRKWKYHGTETVIIIFVID